MRNAACDEMAERKRSKRLHFFLSEVANTESAPNRWTCVYACVMFSTHQAINCASLGLPVPNLSPLTNASAARTRPHRGVSECVLGQGCRRRASDLLLKRQNILGRVEHNETFLLHSFVPIIILKLLLKGNSFSSMLLLFVICLSGFLMSLCKSIHPSSISTSWV